MSKAILYILSVFLLLSGCATKSDSSSAMVEVDSVRNAKEVTAGAQTNNSDPEQRVCRTIRQTGSRVAEKVCRTANEWDKASNEDREAIDRVQRDGNINISSD